MVILYGFGDYAKGLCRKHDIPWDEIEAIIDKEQKIVIKESWFSFLSLGKSQATLARHQNIEDNRLQTISWDEFIKNKENYKAEQIIIGSELYEKEIRKKLLDSGIFSEEKIVFIDDWIVQYPEIEEGGYGGATDNESRLIQLMKEAGEIDNDLLKDAKVMANREEALKLLPKDMIAAEVGVAYGYFSEKILDVCCPKKFFAIDIFSDNVKGIWGNDGFEKANMTHLEWYRTKFSEEISKGIVETRKGFSWECLAQFPDNYFDYLYLDAAHDYDSCRKDVEEVRRVVKPQGIIQFNDYIFYDYMGGSYYGVMPVVNKLVNETKSKVLCYCLSLSGFDDIVVQLNK